MKKFGALLMIGLVPIGVRAQLVKFENVNATSSNRQLELQVLRPTTLIQAISILCSAAEARCQGAEAAPLDLVARITIRGTWTEIVKRLLEGTTTNYIAGEMPDGMSFLVVRTPSNLSSGSHSYQPAALAWNPDVNSISEPSSGSHEIAVTAAETESNEDATIAFSRSAVADAVVANQRSMNRAPGSSESYLPFTGNKARVARSEKTTGSPFPSRCSACRLPPEVRGSPFPDSRGRLIPARPAVPGSPFPVR